MKHDSEASLIRLSGRLNALLQRDLTQFLGWLQNGGLAKQRRHDYRQRTAEELAEAMAAGPTAACSACCEQLRAASQAQRTHLSPTMANLMAKEVALNFHRQLLRHLLNLLISDQGALILRTDLRCYSETMSVILGSSDHPVMELYQLVEEMGNLYLVRPENLRTLLQEGRLGRLDPLLLLPYLARRADWREARGQLGDLANEMMGEGEGGAGVVAAEFGEMILSSLK